MAVAACLASCADGGKEDRPQSEVQIGKQNHVFGFLTLRGFGAFPVSQSEAFTDHFRLDLFTDSTFTVIRGSHTGSPSSYALETTGALSLLNRGSGPEPTVVFLGAYGLEPGPSAATDLFFTDRVSTPNSPEVGFYVGTRIVDGQVELGGAWHVLSLHAIFDETPTTPIPEANDIGRAAHGSIAIAPGAPGTSRPISGSGSESDDAGGPRFVSFGGSIKNVLTSGEGDGTCELTLNYGTDARDVLAVATGNATLGNLVLGLDSEPDDDEAGLVFMVRQFDPPGASADPSKMDGRFLVGGHTLFVKPTNSGSDVFVGVVTLKEPGEPDSFRLDAVGNQGIDFSYIGSYTLSPDGGMTISISGTTETWFAAIDRSYNTLVFVDDFVEVRNIPELNIGFGVRRKD